MSEIKLNLIDSKTILAGTIHDFVGDYCVAALSAEPETIKELEAAMQRFAKEPPRFSTLFRSLAEPDTVPFDSGILIIDLTARIVASESTCYFPEPIGQVNYHDGENVSDLPVCYCTPGGWLFLTSIAEYEVVCKERRERQRARPLVDFRSILFGRPLLEFLATNVRFTIASQLCPDPAVVGPVNTENEFPALLSPTAAIHAQWLLTPREDLLAQSPRDVLLAKQDFINSDLHSRALQWSLQLEGPPCLSTDSVAYRYAGFGTHEWVIYYDLIRYLLESTLSPSQQVNDFEALVEQLDSLKTKWLNEPNGDLDGRIPAIVIENERKRLPEAMGGRSMVVDEDCPICKMMGDECESGMEVCFWHLDGSHMEDHFAFSIFGTEREYLEDRINTELLHREFEQKWKERNERIARGEQVEPDPFFDPPLLDEYMPFVLSEPEPPEA